MYPPYRRVLRRVRWYIPPRRPPPVLPCKTRPPRINSDAIVAVIIIANDKASQEKNWLSSVQGLTPKTINPIAVSNDSPAGIAKFRFKLPNEVLRHASSGPMAVRNSSSNPTGMKTLLKNGAPTFILYPRNHSESMGKNVPHSTVKHAPRRSRLLNMKLDSREMTDSSAFSDRKCLRLAMNATTHTARTSSKNP